VTNQAGEVTGATRPRIAPYYQLLQLPSDQGGEPEPDAEMVMVRPFVPFSDDDSVQVLSSFMAARMDPERYGELVVYEMPVTNRPDGPAIAAGAISGDETVSELENLLGQGGSEVRFGNMLLVPINNALLYVQPFYVVAESRQVPQLQRVIVTYGDEVVIENTLAEALTALFGEQAETQEQPDEEPTGDDGEAQPGEGDEGETAPSGTAAERAATLLEQANDLFAEAEEALADGDLGSYQELNQEAQTRVDEAIDLLSGDAGEPGDANAGDAGDGDGGGAGGGSDADAEGSEASPEDTTSA
jgi:uncharacterized membrane protein (UPF0182 family)